MIRIVCFAGMIGLLLSTVTVTAVGCKPEAQEESPTQINFGTGLAADDEMNALSKAVVRAVEKRMPHLKVVSFENPGGTTEVLKNIKRYDLCGVSLDEAAQAYYGFFAWQGEAHPRLRLLLVIGIRPVAFLAATDTDIGSISELEGQPYGNRGKDDMADFKATKLLEALNIKPLWRRNSLTGQVDHYKHGRLAGFIEYGSGDALLSECNDHRPLIVLEILESELRIAARRYQGSGLIYPPAVLKAGTLPGQAQNIATFGLVMGYYAKQDLPSKVAYNFTQAVWQEVWDVSASYGPLKLDIIGFPKLTLEYGPFPLHTGAVKFYRQIGLEVPDRLLPPEMR